MSVQFGRWHFESQPVGPDYIEQVSTVLAPYGPDSDQEYSRGGITILYRAFHTTKESHGEMQPHISPSGAVITWDGCLDNRAELISDLRDSVTTSSTDVAIVAMSYEKWGTNCFAKLIGDWAISIWNPNNCSLTLAKDPIGTRHLYYSFDNNQVTWSTILEPLVRFAGKVFAITEEYIAGWLAINCPAAHLTPYVGIHAVPPSCTVLLRPGKHTVSKYWDFDPDKRIHYRTDAEYEEHFRTVFAKAVQRKLRSDRPVLAELSGGMDSSSIVCIADTVIAHGDAETPRLDTISWFDDSYDNIEPDTNERRYFTKVEEKRGRVGCHINLRELRTEELCARRSFAYEFSNDRFAATPVPNRDFPELFKRYAEYMRSQGHRVTLSGIGGGEVTGGDVPTPRLELQNLLGRARFFTLAQQLRAWAAKMRKPWLPLLWEAARGFLPLALVGTEDLRLVPWLQTGFVRRNYAALCGYPSRVKLFGPLPSFQDNVRVLEADRRFLAAWTLDSELPREVRFPYFDLDLLQFMYAIPREQVVRVGQRRSLMKRALIGIVPSELLKRRPKLFVPPEPPGDTSTEWLRYAEIARHMASGFLTIINPKGLREALQNARPDDEALIENLKRTLTLDSWLHHLRIQGVLANSMSTTMKQEYSLHPTRNDKALLAPLEAEELQVRVQPQKFS